MKLLVVKAEDGIGYPPISLAYVRDKLVREGYEHDYIHVGDDQIDTVIKECARSGEYYALATGDLVWKYSSLVRILSAWKSANKEAPTIVGGRIVSVLSDELLKNELLSDFEADYLYYGDNLDAFCRLLDTIIDGSAKPAISGQPTTIQADKSKMFQGSPYWGDSNAVGNFCGQRFYPIVTCIGCVGNCHFCCPGVRGVKSRDIKETIDEMVWADKTYDFDVFFLISEIMYAKSDMIEAFCDAYMASGLTQSWTCHLRLDSDLHLLQRIKDAGCINVSVGLESMDEKVLKGMNKRVRPPQIKQFFETAREVGLTIQPMVMAGNPFETPDSLRETADILIEHNMYETFQCLQVYPGTRFYEQNLKHGRIRSAHDSAFKTNEIAKRMSSLSTVNMSAMKDIELYETILENEFRMLSNILNVTAQLNPSQDPERFICHHCGNAVEIKLLGSYHEERCPHCLTQHVFNIYSHTPNGKALEWLKDADFEKGTMFVGRIPDAFFFLWFLNWLNIDTDNLCFYIIGPDYPIRSFCGYPVVSVSGMHNFPVDQVVYSSTCLESYYLAGSVFSSIPSLFFPRLSDIKDKKYISHIENVDVFCRPNRFFSSFIEKNGLGSDKTAISIAPAGSFATKMVESIFPDSTINRLYDMNHDTIGSVHVNSEKIDVHPYSQSTDESSPILILTPNTNAQEAIRNTLLGYNSELTIYTLHDILLHYPGNSPESAETS